MTDSMKKLNEQGVHTLYKYMLKYKSTVKKASKYVSNHNMLMYYHVDVEWNNGERYGVSFYGNGG